MQIKIKTPLPIMEVRVINKEDLLNHPVKEYNPSEWKRVVERYSKYGDVVFLERINSTNSYSEIFAIYTINEGIRLFNTVSYGGCLSNSGFVKVYHYEDNTIRTEKPFEQGLVANNKDGRKWMAKMSSEFGHIFSNNLPLSKIKEITVEVPELVF
jgi:hypothetical protein